MQSSGIGNTTNSFFASAQDAGIAMGGHFMQNAGAIDALTFEAVEGFGNNLMDGFSKLITGQSGSKPSENNVASENSNSMAGITPVAPVKTESDSPAPATMQQLAGLNMAGLSMMSMDSSPVTGRVQSGIAIAVERTQTAGLAA